MSSEAAEPADALQPAEGTEATEAVPVEDEVTPAEPDWVELPSGEALNDEGAAETMKVSPTKTVLVAGENDTGKTSLLCGVYERYMNDDFAGHLFCGSRTLRAFERRSFYQRAESGRSEPDTERTRLPAGQLELLHLELQSKTSAERVALLATDLAGEAFNLIRDNPEECEKYPILSRVDCVTVLLDAARLGTEDRHAHRNSTRMTLRSLLQSGKLRPGVPVVVALSKWDLVDGSMAKEQAGEDALAVLGPAKDRPHDVVRIAAAPTRPGSVAAGYGLKGLVSTWIGSASPAEEVEFDAETAEAPAPTSGFDLFTAEDESA